MKTNFYKVLFASEPDPRIKLGQNFWSGRGRLEEVDNQLLIRPFSMEELEAAVSDMKTNTAPGPDGFFTGFSRNFGGKLRGTSLRCYKLYTGGSWICQG